MQVDSIANSVAVSCSKGCSSAHKLATHLSRIFRFCFCLGDSLHTAAEAMHFTLLYIALQLYSKSLAL